MVNKKFGAVIIKNLFVLIEYVCANFMTIFTHELYVIYFIEI